MRLRETTVARLGLLALAIALWRHAASLISDGLLPRYPQASVLLVVIYVVSFCALLVAASSSEKAARYARFAIVGFVVAIAAVAFRDGVRKATSDFLPTNDGHVFMDVAARYVLHGKNPYVEGLADAFRIYRMPMSYSTPLLDGDFSDRQAYPALSFLVLVPALVAHVPTYFVYAAAFIVAAAIVIQKAPWWARPIVVAAFAVEETYCSCAFGGVTDNVWLVLLVGAVVWWQKRPTAAAVLVGLACAYKQHPWFLMPLLLVRVGYDHGERPWGRASRRFLAIVGGVFVAVNIPFVLWSPRAWFAGITEPLSAPMVQLSDGFTSLSMTGWISMPRAGTSVFFWLLYALALFAYARHTKVLRDWCWIVPAVVLWFGYRALMSYWYYFGVLALLAIVSRDDAANAEPEGEAGPPVSWRPIAIASGVVAAGFAAFVVWCAARPAPFLLFVASPTQAWEMRGLSLRVRVVNRLARKVTPQFWLQSNGVQPLPWSIDFGPRELPPGASAEYGIRASRVFNEFDIAEGARLEVHDRTDPGQRAFLTIPSERTVRLPDAVPNPWFNVIETRSQVPTGWSFESSDARLTIPNDLGAQARVRFDFSAGSVPTTSSLAVCVGAQHLGDVIGGRRAVLSTVLPLPEGTLTFHIDVPPDANRAPYDVLYGVSLSVRDGRVLVLFGEDVERGTLPTGETFTSLPVKRGEWATVDLKPREILERLRVPLYMSRYRYVRMPSLDFPSIPVEMGLFARGPAGPASVQFGRIDQDSVRPTDELAAHPSPAGLAAWRAEMDIENGNYAKGAELLERANAAEPNVERLTKLGDAYLLEKDYAHARDAYARALSAASAPEAEQGIGFALIELGEFADASRHLERSRDFYDHLGQNPRPWRYANAIRGLMRISDLQGRCDMARRYRDELVVETPTMPLPLLVNCR